MTLRYRLSLASDLAPYRPEIEHALLFLERCHPLVRAPDAARVLHYGAEPPAGAVHVPNVLFPGCVRVDENGIHPRHDALAEAESGLLPPARGRAGAGHVLGYDAIGLTFFLLSRIEERGHEALDRYGRFPHGAALAVRRAGGAGPLADEAAEDLACALMDRDDPPTLTRYALAPTHDVDMLRGYHRWWEPLRHAAGDALKRHRPARALRRLSGGYFAGEPWRSLEALMGASEARGLTSRFFLMGPSRDPMDSPYAADDRALLRRVADAIAGRGHVLGFHPGFATATDEAEWRRQRRGLEDAIGRPVREGRQHVLRYAAAATPDIWDEAGMALDLSLAWPEVTGFRSGTCRPHRAYSLRRRRTLALEQVSTAVMEFGLFGGKYRDLSVEDALDACRPALDACRRFGGTFAVLMHTHQRRPPETVFYERLLDMAS